MLDINQRKKICHGLLDVFFFFTELVMGGRVLNKLNKDLPTWQ